MDLALSKLTVIAHISKMRNFLNQLQKPIATITKEDIRGFLEKSNEKYAPTSYNGYVKAFRRFFRDYLNEPELSKFKLLSVPFKPKMLSFEKADLVKFYNAIENKEVQMMFLAYCVTGLRRNDVFDLMAEEIDTEKRMIVKNNSSRTKLKWVTFYNEELAGILHPHLETLNDDSERVFSLKEWKMKLYWDRARDKTKLDIKRKDLRDFFCIEMTELGVPDKFIDAYCGRVPKSVLARYYTDYSPKRLKAVYDKAGSRILS